MEQETTREHVMLLNVKSPKHPRLSLVYSTVLLDTLLYSVWRPQHIIIISKYQCCPWLLRTT